MQGIVAPIIPGPLRIPVVGGRAHLLQLFGQPFSYLRHLHAAYGDVAGLARGDTSYVCAFGPDLNHQVLSDPDRFEVSAGPFQKMTADTSIGRIAAHSLQLMKGEYHKQQRRLMQPAFHRQQLASYHDDTVTLTQRMIAQWRHGLTLDMYHEMEQATRNIVVKTLFGLEDGAMTEQMGVMMQQLVGHLSRALLLPFDLPGTPYRRALRLASELELMLQRLIADKRSHPGGTDLLSVLIDARDEDGGTLSDTELLSHTFTIFSAGHETTTSVLTWTLFLLDQHPDCYDRLLEELARELHGEPPTGEQVRSLAVLDGVIKESLRLLPPAVLGMRRTTAPTELGGYALPAGTTIVYSGFVTHRLATIYPEPDRFMPERWATLKPTTYEYIPFSAGPHRCIGAEFALHELKVMLATILQHYQPTIVPNAVISTNLTMRPRRGMPMRLVDRKSPASRPKVRGNINQLVDLAP